MTNTGNLAELIDFAISVGANAFELYPYEWLIANDSCWCNMEKEHEHNWHEKYGKQYGKALEKASNRELAK